MGAGPAGCLPDDWLEQTVDIARAMNDARYLNHIVLETEKDQVVAVQG